MPKLNLPPTKSVLLRVKRDLSFAAEGYELLEQKRQILAIELMSRLENARAVQKDVDLVMSAAFEALGKARVVSGEAVMQSESLGIVGTHETGVTEQRVMGINVPAVRVTVKPLAPEFAPGSGSAQSDEVMKSFRKALEAIGKLAEVENAVIRLSRELKKTQRRVNALEKIFLPDYRDTVKDITEVLEERERDGFVIMKMTKDRMERREATHGGADIEGSGPVLLVVDGSEASGKAARRAAAMASSLKTRLVALAVIDTETLEYLRRANILVREEVEDFERGLAESAKHHLKLVRGVAREAGAHVEEVIARGGWHQTVLDKQREIGARVIVLSGFTATMVHHDSLERAKQRIIEEAPCDVVVAR